MSRILILGGTAEARALAGRLDGHEVITSLAGRTRKPATPAGELRSGGFGGTAGLAAYLRQAGIEAVIDATHPFAAEISANAVAACEQEGVPRVALVRPPWRAEPGDDWTEVADADAAAAALAGHATAFLAVGRQGLAPFARCRDIAFVVRVVEPPDALPLATATVVTGRGPFALADERALLAEHRIEVVVAKNAGGDRAKLDAARQAGLPVILIARPPPPPGQRAETVADAVAWLTQL
jgi:precorrin-6A/cobalt-precorrin-6A reductase